MMQDTEPRHMEVARVVQLTDCHLGPDPDFTLAGIRTRQTFTEVLDAIRRERDPVEMVMATGDIAAKGNVDAYRLFLREMRESGLPFAWLPGNHDDFRLMQESVHAAPYWPVLDMGEWRLVSLNTAVPGRVGGLLSREELSFLRNTLSREHRHPVAIFMHHPPLDIGCAWLDEQKVANSDELAGILREAGNIKAIFTGHVHQPVATEFAGIPLLTTPSTCFQFAADSDDFALDDAPPAYRRIELYANGLFRTELVSVASSQRVDTRISGY